MQAPDIEESLDVDAMSDTDVGEAATEPSDETEFQIVTAAYERTCDTD